jgi:hypothetical protein
LTYEERKKKVMHTCIKSLLNASRHKTNNNNNSNSTSSDQNLSITNLSILKSTINNTSISNSNTNNINNTSNNNNNNSCYWCGNVNHKIQDCDTYKNHLVKQSLSSNPFKRQQNNNQYQDHN